MPTIRDIANLAQVSTATVSHVINNTSYVSPPLRERVQQAIRQLNYRPNAVARSLRTRQSRTVGMIIPDLTDPFFPAVVRGAEDVLMEQGYTLLVGNSDNQASKEEAYYHAFNAKRVDGLLLIFSGIGEQTGYLRRHSSESLPLVYVDRFHNSLTGDSVQADQAAGMRLAVEHLVGLGHARIGILTGPLATCQGAQRFEAYRQALAAAGIAERREWVAECDFDLASARESLPRLLQGPQRPTAVLTSCGIQTLGAVQALRQSGLRFPDDLSLISFDDLEVFALAEPGLTAVAQPAYQIGVEGARILLERLGNPEGDYRHVLLPMELKQRGSCRSALNTPRA